MILNEEQLAVDAGNGNSSALSALLTALFHGPESWAVQTARYYVPANMADRDEIAQDAAQETAAWLIENPNKLAAYPTLGTVRGCVSRKIKDAVRTLLRRAFGRREISASSFDTDSEDASNTYEDILAVGDSGVDHEIECAEAIAAIQAAYRKCTPQRQTVLHNLVHGVQQSPANVRRHVKQFLKMVAAEGRGHTRTVGAETDYGQTAYRTSAEYLRALDAVNWQRMLRTSLRSIPDYDSGNEALAFEDAA